jgi:hypothetical protein
MMNDLTVTDPSFSPGFAEWLATADLDEIAGEFSDAYKEANGFRPRHYNFDAMTRNDFAKEFIWLGEQMKREAEFERQEQEWQDKYGPAETRMENFRADPRPLAYEAMVPNALMDF